MVGVFHKVISNVRNLAMPRPISGFLCLLLLQFGCAASSLPPTPAPGPGPISPSTKPQTPPIVSPLPEKPIEVPIGRQEGYDEEKRKAKERTVTPPGVIQEDPAVLQRREKSGPNNEKK